MRTNAWMLALLATAVLGAGARAQSTAGPGTGAGAGGPGTDLDLPIERPAAPPVDPTDPTDPTDPKDEEPPVIYGEEIPSESDSIYYVLDISGSMDWDSASYVDLEGNRRVGTRIDRAKCELIRSIQGLSRNFKFNIIAYDCGTFPWSPVMRQAEDASKAAATGWVNGLQPMGATGTGPATALALAERENLSVVLLTDGAPNCGAGSGWGSDTLEAHRVMIRGANAQRATISVFGIAASGEYRAFCQNVAADAGGSYFDVP